jgi:transcriptional regulator with XRE-family HTH domain
MSFTRWIKEQRVAKGMTTKECARRAGVSQPVWSRYEDGDDAGIARDWKRSTVIKIAHALDAPVDEAIQAAFPRDAANAFSVEALEFARLMDSLPAPRRSAMLRVARSAYEALASV